jgi:hypothetical protein
VISTWALQKEFNEGQERGTIPAEEDFDPIWIQHQGTTIEEVHPHWISLRARLHVQRLHKQRKLPSMTFCGVTFVDERKNYRGVEWVDVAAGSVISVESAMKRQTFPIYLGELFGEILFILLYEKLLHYFETGDGAVSPRRVEKLLNDYASSYCFASSHTGSTSVNARVAVENGKLSLTACTCTWVLERTAHRTVIEDVMNAVLTTKTTNDCRRRPYISTMCRSLLCPLPCYAKALEHSEWYEDPRFATNQAARSGRCSVRPGL